MVIKNGSLLNISAATFTQLCTDYERNRKGLGVLILLHVTKRYNK